MPDVFKALQVPALEHNGPGDHRSNAIDGEKHLVICSRFEGFQHGALDSIDLRIEHPDEGCLPTPAKSNGFLWITFSLDALQVGSIFSGVLPVRAPHARISIDVCRQE